jgi:hypothetical protein
MGQVFTRSWIFAVALALAGCSSDSGDGENGNADEAASGAEDRDGDGQPDGAGSGADGNSDDGSDDDGNLGGDPNGGGSGSGSGSDPVPGSDLPRFPGSGTSDAGDPLPNGMLCDAVPGQDLPIADGGEAVCFFDKNDPNSTTVAATLEQVLECVEETDTVHIRLTLHPWFVDNTYGANAIGWPNRRGHCFGHCWNDLVKSDHAEIILTDAGGNIVLRFKLDYISEDASQPSGYGSLGVTGGDGSVTVGDAASVVKWSTSIDRNLNERGYASYIPDSPATDEDFTANPDAPEWDFRVVYEAWVDLSIFDAGGFGGATIEYVHASPSKLSTDTIETTPRKCPPPPNDCEDNDPDTWCSDGGAGNGGGGTGGGGNPCEDNDPDTVCNEGGTGGGSGNGSGGNGSGGNGSGGTGGSGSSGTGGGGDPCEDNDPDTVCNEGGSAGGGDPQYCTDHPTDPACVVD